MFFKNKLHSSSDSARFIIFIEITIALTFNFAKLKHRITKKSYDEDSP